VGLLAEGEIPAGTLISRIEPLDRAAQAFAALESGAGVMKVLVDCRANGKADAR
jgi:threonine dehydrogenase-like Zn-dependent dehydrogenase